MPAQTRATIGTQQLFQALTATPFAARDLVFQAVTGIKADDLEALMLSHTPLPDVSVRSIMHNLGELLDLRRSEVAELLNISPSRVSRNDKVSISILDCTGRISDVFALVSAVLGPEHARAWFKHPNPALGGKAPYQLMGTSYGAKRVENLVTALLNGSFV